MQNEYRKRLLEVITAVRKRLNLILFAETLVYGLAFGFVAWTLVSVVSMIFPVYHLQYLGAIVLLPTAAASVAYYFSRRIDNRKAALAADSHGLKERLTTALENLDKDDIFSNIQRAEAVRSVENFKPSAEFPFRINLKPLGIFVITLAIAVTSASVKTEARELAEKQHGVKVEAEKKKEELEKELAELTEEYNLTEAETAELEKIFEEAAEELKKSLTDEELSKAEERYESKLEQSLKKSVTENASEIAKAKANVSELATNADLTDEQKQALLNQAKEAAENAGNQELSDATDQASNELKNNGEISEDTLNKLAQAAENAQTTANSDLAKAGINNSQLANNSNSGNSNQSSQSGQNSQSGSSSQSGQNSQSQSGSSSNSQNQSGNSNSGENGSSGQSGQSGQNGQGQSGQSGQGGQGSGSQGQSGSGSGSGNGNGNSQTGQGWDTGSDTGSEQASSTGGERITVPNGTSDESLTGKGSEGGDSSATSQGPTLTWEGVSGDYKSVIGDYTKQAYDDLDTTDVPSSMQDYIKDYFTELNK